VLAALQKLMEREPALVTVLPRQPGTKESRYAHLLSGDVEFNAIAEVDAARVTELSATGSAYEERIAQLESTVAELREEVNALRQKIDGLLG
jgi:uncharacterized protein YceH (UPF0502 family)